VVKHAEASEVKISLSRADGNVHVRIADDGKGFDLETVASKAARRAGLGLFSIRERLAQLGGSVDVASRPNRGTRILTTAPLKKTQTDNTPQSD
jgi:signal transduction histidine kinase